MPTTGSIKAQETTADIVPANGQRPSAGSDGPIGYVSAITLKVLSDRAEGHGFVVACAGYDTTIPVYAHPAPPAAASVREALTWALNEIELEFTRNKRAYPADKEKKVLFERYKAIVSEPAPAAPTREEIIEECALVADGFDAACDSPRMKLFVEAGLVLAIYKRDGEIGAAIRELKSRQSQAVCVERSEK